MIWLVSDADGKPVIAFKGEGADHRAIKWCWQACLRVHPTSPKFVVKREESETVVRVNESKTWTISTVPVGEEVVSA